MGSRRGAGAQVAVGWTRWYRRPPAHLVPLCENMKRVGFLWDKGMDKPTERGEAGPAPQG